MNLITKHFKKKTIQEVIKLLEKTKEMPIPGIKNDETAYKFWKYSFEAAISAVENYYREYLTNK